MSLTILTLSVVAGLICCQCMEPNRRGCGRKCSPVGPSSVGKAPGFQLFRGAHRAHVLISPDFLWCCKTSDADIEGTQYWVLNGPLWAGMSVDINALLQQTARSVLLLYDVFRRARRLLSSAAASKSKGCVLPRPMSYLAF
jgi:hypothetical protein